MSTLKCLATEILGVEHHPDADRLDIVKIIGWECIVGRDRYKIGDVVVYIPIDAVVPKDVSDRFGFTQYLSGTGRVKAAKLRGITSYGIVLDNETNAELGTDLADHYGIVKYEPPKAGNCSIKCGKAAERHPLLNRYTDIENIKNYNSVFDDGEEVVVTEKCHGTNCIHAIVDNPLNIELPLFLASSHSTQRKEEGGGVYWQTFDEKTKNLLRTIKEETGAHIVSVYKEIYGYRIQNLQYGLDKTQEVKDIAFDISIDNCYIDYSRFCEICDRFGLERVPELYRGPFNGETIDKVINGENVKTIIGKGCHILEGGVVKPIIERTNRKVGRVILKWISHVYATGKNTDWH